MEKQAREAIKKFLEDNESTFFNGIVVNDAQRGWGHVTVSGVTPPTKYYYASVFVEDAPIAEVEQSGLNLVLGRVNHIYDVSVVIIDYITGATGENELYETMDKQFQTVTDRVKWMIFDEADFTYDVSYDVDYDPTSIGATHFTIPRPRRVNKSNTLVRWPEADSYWAVLATQVTFQLEECIVL